MRKNKKLFLSLCLAFVLTTAAGIVACDDAQPDTGSVPPSSSTTPDKPATSILSLQATKTAALRGDVITLSTIIRTEGKEDVVVPNIDVTYTIVEGAEYATISDNTLTISETAPANASIKVKATVGLTDSNLLEIKVNVPLESITVSDATDTNLKPGVSVVLKKTFLPDGAEADGFKWTITEGGDYAEVVGDVLMVSADAPIGSTITVKAECGEIEGDKELSFTVVSGIIALEEIIVSDVNVTNLKPGASLVLGKTFKPQGADTTGFKWTITAGGDYAEVVGDVLMVSEEAPIDTVITVKAECGDIVGDKTLSFTVGIPVESVNIALVGSANVDPGDYRLIDVTLNQGATMQTINWTITEGNDVAEISNNILTISEEATIGTQVTFYATVGGKNSAPITVTVGKPIENIVLTANKTEVVKGGTAVIDYTLDPPESEALFTWKVVLSEGEGWASVSKNGVLSVSADAPTDGTITVTAISGDTESNTLTFTVVRTQEEINAEKYYLVLSSDSVNVDARGNTATTLSAKLYNYNRVEIKDKDISFRVAEGETYLALTDEGNYCTFTAKGHGAAEVEVYVDGIEVETETANVNVIVPPDIINLPEVFAERLGFVYNFSMNKYTYTKTDITAAGKDALPFVATATSLSENVLPCMDLIYTFKHEDGSYGDEVATWANGNILFHKTGKVTVTVTSASGSIKETSISYSFNINEGYNVYSFAEAATLTASAKYNGQVINFVALEILTDGDGNVYKYQFVPETALKKLSEQTIAEVANSNNNRIIAVNKSVHINGNNHTVNASHFKLFSNEEILAYKHSANTTWEHHGGLISAEPWTRNYQEEAGQIVGDFYARFYDLKIIGNTDYATYTHDNSTGNPKFLSGYESGINVGNITHPNAHYTVDINNITVSACKDGIRIAKVVDGLAKDLTVFDCVQNGIFLRASILKLEDITISRCGAVGIELAPELSDAAGKTNTQTQSITFLGNIDVTGNINPPNSDYLQKYQGGAVPQLIQAALLLNGISNNPYQVSHLMDAQNNLCLVTFIMHNTAAINYSQAYYPSYQEGGIIDATALPTDGIDTTHQFISLTIYNPQVSQTTPIGTALLYNLNYGK